MTAPLYGGKLGGARRGDFPHLRTRVAPGGMDFKGYNIAVHEMGHSVEQVFSLYEVDSTLLAGVAPFVRQDPAALLWRARPHGLADGARA